MFQLLESNDDEKLHSRSVLRLYHKRTISKKVLSRFNMKDCSLRDTTVAKGDNFSLT